MKPRAYLIRRTMLPLLGVWLLAVTSAPAGPTNPAAKPTSPGKTNALAKATATGAAAITNEVIEIPKSVFLAPTNAAQGKDPFFPHSTYPYGTTVVTTSNRTNAAVKVPELDMTGVSGTPEKPLAIINNVTFGVGDLREVVLGTKRISVQCLEINLTNGTSLVQVSGQRRTLKLKTSK